MEFTTRFTERAYKQMQDSVEWYDLQRPGLGDEFLNAVMAKVKLISEHPLRYPERNKKFRETPVRKFPFVIVYKLNKNLIQIAAIFHTRRSPKVKYKKAE